MLNRTWTIKKLLKSPWNLAGVRRITRKAHQKSLTILMYHGITAEPLPVYNWCHIPLNEFRGQMAFLAENYTVLPLIEAVTRIRENKPLPDFAACITFDDAFRSVQDNALPLLEQHQLPATLFVVTGLAEEGQPAWPERLLVMLMNTRKTNVRLWDTELPLETAEDRSKAHSVLLRMLRNVPVEQKEKELTMLAENLVQGTLVLDETSPVATLRWPEIETLAKNNLFHFGPHTHNHEELPMCAPEEQRKEIAASHELLKEHIGYSEIFAYPNGRFTAETKNIVRGLGLRAAVTTKHALNSENPDLFELSRVGIGAGLEQFRFEAKILGY